jgi:hypothetical protein
MGMGVRVTVRRVKMLARTYGPVDARGDRAGLDRNYG